MSKAFVCQLQVIFLRRALNRDLVMAVAKPTYLLSQKIVVFVSWFNKFLEIYHIYFVFLKKNDPSNIFRLHIWLLFSGQPMCFIHFFLIVFLSMFRIS